MSLGLSFSLATTAGALLAAASMECHRRPVGLNAHRRALLDELTAG